MELMQAIARFRATMLWLAQRMEAHRSRQRFAADRRLLLDMSEADLLDIGLGRCEVSYITDHPDDLGAHCG